MNEQFCNNCGKRGHLFHKCKIPITSFGIVTFRIKEGNIQYLMIRRKHTLGYIDFIRGKYSISNYEFLLNLFKQMTVEEKEKIKSMSFDSLWKEIWGSNSSLSMQYKSELYSSRDKFHILKNVDYINHKNTSTVFTGPSLTTSQNDVSNVQQKSPIFESPYINNQRYNLETLVKESENFDKWEEPEWGFPKGRRNYQETDFECALREFNEETGFDTKLLKPIQNILPFEETFTGSNYKSYKHKYYLSYIDYDKTFDMDNYERSEVSKMEWKSFDECVNIIRGYNLEKIRMIQTIDKTLNTYKTLFF